MICANHRIPDSSIIFDNCESIKHAALYHSLHQKSILLLPRYLGQIVRFSRCRVPVVSVHHEAYNAYAYAEHKQYCFDIDLCASAEARTGMLRKISLR